MVLAEFAGVRVAPFVCWRSRIVFAIEPVLVDPSGMRNEGSRVFRDADFPARGFF